MTDISLTKLTKIYGHGDRACRAVDDVDLEIGSGEFFFLLGPSGCGKTTLLRMIAGLILPTSGRIHFGDRDVTDDPVHRRDAAMVFQNYALWPHMNVQANVEFGPRMQKLASGERRARALHCLELVRMSDYGLRRPRQLSGGQQQRIALARALAAQPSCLLLDEPLSNLDAQLRLQMREQLREIVKQTGTTAIYVTHDQKEALAMADRMAVMKDGQVIQVGKPVDLYEKPESRFVAEFVGEANFIEGIITGFDSGKAIIETVDGEFGARRTVDCRPGQHVTCCVRPERVCLRETTGPGPLRARIASTTYQGETTQHRVALPSGLEWKVLEVGGTSQMPVGREAELAVESETVVFIGD